MCGIAGGFGKADPATVGAMLARLAHRGPDDEFLVSGTRFTLGARRLAIIDPEAGRQPLSNESGTVWAVQNGELYNFPELRPGLEAKGHRFRTHSDTEIIPHLYEDWGPDFVARPGHRVSRDSQPRSGPDLDVGIRRIAEARHVLEAQLGPRSAVEPDGRRR